MEPVIHLRDAVCLLGRYPALAGVDLTVGHGETVLLQGPNGAGKTTLLRLCAGLQAVTSGSASVLGVDLVADHRPVRTRVGLLGHATFLYDELTVRDNVQFWTRAARAEPGDADRALERLGLAGRLAEVKVSRLSTGQRRRTAIAVLVARRPELWLLDEPHAGLDRDGRDLLDGLIAEAVDAGATVVVVSHETERAARLAPRHVTITGGTITHDTAVSAATRSAALEDPAGAVGRAP